MPIELLRSSVKVTAGSTFSFTFQNPVQQYAFGISAFQVTYGDDKDEWIRTLSIQISPQGVDNNKVSGLVKITMEDDSQHSAKSSSFVIPVCIAVTKSPDVHTMIGNAPAIANRSNQSVTFPNPQSGLSYTCFQSGFNLSFAQKDHQVLKAYAGCDITNPRPEGGQISSTAGLEDGSGNQVDVATVDAGYIATLSSPGIAFEDLKGQTQGPTSVTIDKWASVSSAIAIIKDWQVRFQSVNNVQTITVGAWGANVTDNISTNKNTVTIPQLYGGIADNSSNRQDNENSYCAMQIVALGA